MSLTDETKFKGANHEAELRALEALEYHRIVLSIEQVD